ncbi:rod shape-determining protein MreC [Oscillospiraceae bacterium Marseille-Q3528]|nr:rod shape-determining protein MreC [Oscillospiraceae bacterium Marseille-Q3528]WNV56591.1 rod shape-determining protein MreC [Oscillospiraceae bacterium NTUH-002-81]
MRRKSKFSLPSKYMLLLLTILCVGMMFVTFVTNVNLEPVQTVSGYVIVPIQKGINNIGLWLSDKVDYRQTLQELQAENQQLKEKVNELTIENSELVQDTYELGRLRDMYQLDAKYPGYTKVAARVIGKDAGNWFSTFMIDKGTDDGINIDCNVIADGGLVGIVTRVGKDWASVRSIIDDSSNVSAMTLSTSDTCIVKGDLELMSDGHIQLMQLLDEADKIQVGEEIVTSNISVKYLEGIPIGYVSELSYDANKLTKSGTITPIADFQHLQEVLVITDRKEMPAAE